MSNKKLTPTENTEYRIDCTANVFRGSTARQRAGYSINTYLNGKYLYQTAFWFKTETDARTRLAEIVAEDKAKKF